MASTAADRARRGRRVATEAAAATGTGSALHDAIFRDGSEPAAAPAPRAPEPEAPSEVKPVRVTTDLPRGRYRALVRALNDMADDLGVAKVDGQVVREQLVALLVADRRTYLMIRAAVAREMGVPNPNDD